MSEIVLWTVILVTMSTSVTGGVGLAKRFWMRRAGVPEPWLSRTFQSRAGFDLSGLLDAFEQSHMLRIDGLSRKTSHFIKWFFTLYTAQVLMTAELAANASLGRALVILTGGAITYRMNHWVSTLFYGSDARVLDGKLGRANVITVRCLSVLHTVFLNVFALVYIFPTMPPEYQKLAIPFIYLPIAIGDAMGEIIGSAFGKQNIKVWGVGEINRKSWEGTAAVFFGSFLPLLGVIWAYDLTGIFYGLALLLSAQTTVVELITPRGMDSLTLPVTNLLTTYFFYQVFLGG